MSEENIQPTQESAMWPPMPSVSSVWPPPPTAFETANVPYKNIYLTAKGFISDFRVGNLSVYNDGITIFGKAVMPSERQYWYLVFFFFIRLWLIVALLLEYVYRNANTLTLKWDEIDEIVYQANKRRVCIVYHQTDKKGRVRQFSLATTLDQLAFEEFVRAISVNAPNTIQQIQEGKMSSSFRSAAGWSLLTGWIVVGSIVGIMYLLGMHLK